MVFYSMVILVIEDDFKIGDYLCKGLCEFGYVVDFVCIGSDGLYMVLE